MQDSTQNQALTTSFHITPNSLFMTVWWCTVSLLIPASNKDKGKAVPICTIKVCVLVEGRGGSKGVVAFILLVLNGGYGMAEWGKGVQCLAVVRGVSLVPCIHTGSVTYTTSYTIKERTGLTMHHHLVPKYYTWRLSAAISASSYTFLVWCIVKHRNNFTLKYFTWNSIAPSRLPK